jgi:glycosyltransferase involved in cell wall biosynthesis
MRLNDKLFKVGGGEGIMPEISIVIPVYNKAKYLRRCFDSVLSQNYINWECILVDDGSTDNGGAICDEYAKKDKRIHVIHQQHAGVSMARNNGINAATGERLTFIDSDDYITPGYLEHLINYDADIVISGLYLINPPKSKIWRIENHSVDVISNCGKYLPELEEQGLINGAWCKLYRLSIIRSNSVKFNKHFSYGEDTLFVFSYLKYCQTMALCDSVDYYYDLTVDASTSLSRNPPSSKKLYEFCCLLNQERNELYQTWQVDVITLEYLQRRERNVAFAYIYIIYRDTRYTNKERFDFLKTVYKNKNISRKIYLEDNLKNFVSSILLIIGNVSLAHLFYKIMIPLFSLLTGKRLKFQ